MGNQTKMRTLNVVAVCSPRGMSPLLGPGRLDILYAPISPLKRAHRKTEHAKKDVACTLLRNIYVFLATYNYFFLHSPTFFIQCTKMYILYQCTHCLSIISLLSVSLAY